MPQETFRRFTPTSYNKDQRSATGILATENPIRVFDFLSRTGGTIDEVVLMSGAEIPESGQIPLLDSHDRGSVRSVLGSCRNLRVESKQLVADLHFADDEAGRDLERKVADGHISDLSIGAEILRYDEIQPDTESTVEGKTITGPARVVTAWRPFEASAVAVGADSQSIIRSKNKMSDNQNQTQTAQPDPATGQADDLIRAERTRINEINKMCRTFAVDEIANDLVNRGAPIAEAKEAILRYYQRVNPPFGHNAIVVEQSDMEKRGKAMVDGLLQRAGVQIKDPTPGANDFRHSSLVDISKMLLSEQGVTTRGLSNSKIADMAMTQRSQTTADFPFLLQNAGNKALRQLMEQSPSTWDKWCRIGTAKDYKTLYRNAISAAPELKKVEEMEEYQHGGFSEAQESYAIGKFGRIVGFSREAIVNDDLSAFTDTLRMLAIMAERRINNSVYAILTSNPTMADGDNLFHANHSNLASGGDAAALSATTLGTALTAMRLQTGLSGEVLNIPAKYLIIPATLEVDALELLESTGNTANDKNAGVANPFYRRLEPVVEAQLDSDSTAAFYIACDPNQFDSVEVSFLNGERYPDLESREGWSVDRIEFKVRLEFGCAAIDHRGLYKNPGE